MAAENVPGSSAVPRLVTVKEEVVETVHLEEESPDIFLESCNATASSVQNGTDSGQVGNDRSQLAHGADLTLKRIRVNTNYRVPMPRSPGRLGRREIVDRKRISKTVSSNNSGQPQFSKNMSRWTIGSNKYSTKDVLFYSLAMLSSCILFALVSAVMLTYLCNSFVPGMMEQAYRKPSGLITYSSSSLTPQSTHNPGVVTNLCGENPANLSCIEDLDFQNRLLDDMEKKCRDQNREFQSKIEILEEEISNLRQKFSEKLAEKDEYVKRIVRKVAAFRREHIFISIATFNKFLTTSMIISTSSCLFYYYRYV